MVTYFKMRRRPISSGSVPDSAVVVMIDMGKKSFEYSEYW